MATTPRPELLDQKRRLRRAMAERRLALPAAERLSCARAVAERLLALPELGRGGRLSGYVAVRGELDPAAALDGARAAGFVVALPRIDTRWPPTLRFHRVAGATDLCDGPHGLTEPLPSCPAVPLADLDVMLVPGLAFDAAGGRLGQGGGYYDGAGRELRARRAAAALMVGLAYDFQVVDACPVDENDVPVDLVVTERRVLDARPARRAAP
ncbi:MAG TPA: 5-formyltetrahydrofolate cyclo-ligase [Polyangia bacterium]|nr:5-formyltetrahydrofolate cyclo-ligase [Polyangia bacterium]